MTAGYDVLLVLDSVNRWTDTFGSWTSSKRQQIKCSRIAGLFERSGQVLVDCCVNTASSRSELMAAGDVSRTTTAARSDYSRCDCVRSDAAYSQQRSPLQLALSQSPSIHPP